MQKFYHQASKFNGEYKCSCKKCKYSIRISLGKKEFYKCNKGIGTFNLSSKFKLCKEYKEV